MTAEGGERALIEAVLGRPVANASRAAWGFTNRTDIVTPADGERVVLQRYRRRRDAERRLRVMRALSGPAGEAGIRIPRVLESGLDADPAWVVFAVLPGVPVPEAGDAAPGGSRFVAMAEAMGRLLAAFRGLRVAGIDLDGPWADPERLGACAASWIREAPGLDRAQRSALDDLVARVPALFADRPVVLAHGDFAPVNVLTDGGSVTGLLDFESVRRADPLFDVAWWAWAVSFASAAILETAWPVFLRGAGIDPADRELPARVRALQILRMLELLAEDPSLDPGVRRVVADRLRAMASADATGV